MPTATKPKLRIAVLQRVCPGYREALFSQLSNNADIEFKLFIGEDLPQSKVKSSMHLKGVNLKKLKTRFINVGRRVLPWHIGLIKELKEFDPDVILCEGESHFLGYIQAIFYRTFHRKNTALMHWCFISLPGPESNIPFYRTGIKRFFRIFFDAFVLYSSFSKERLCELGIPTEKAFVATNVGDVTKFLDWSESISESKFEMRNQLKIPNKFTVLYLGTLDENKRPGDMLDLAANCEDGKYNFVLLGAGPLLERLRGRVKDEGLSDVFLPGRVVEELGYYYRCADVLLIPGRGGIVISEAMAFGVPVVVHQADGTEFDLVLNEITGLHLKKGEISDVKKALDFLYAQPNLCRKMGEESRRLIKDTLSTENMVNQIVNASHYAIEKRKMKLQ